MIIPFYMLSACEEALSPDPYLERPDPQTVESLAGLVMWAAKVSKARRKSLANEPWKAKPPERHLGHAAEHVRSSQAALRTEDPSLHIDKEDGLPELAHAALRIAFALWLLKDEFNE